MEFATGILASAWELFLDSAPFMVLGLLVAGLLRAFISPAAVARHFGTGRFWPVVKASALGVPLPLCSCGVLPAAVSMKKQGANNGAVASFLVSTPESGVDSMAVTYALLDPLMTVLRPVAAMVTALAAGLGQNFLDLENGRPAPSLEPACCPPNPEEEPAADGMARRLSTGLWFAFSDVWADMAGWFAVGLLAAGAVMALVPEDALAAVLGGGMGSMLIMLAAGIPLYICATASTPIAAALILKGVSPGAALVFLLAGPATNITSLAVLFGVLGKRATVVHLGFIAAFSLAFGLLADGLYSFFGVSAQALAGKGAEALPHWTGLAAGLFLLALSAPLLARRAGSLFSGRTPAPSCPLENQPGGT
ncbi:MAG: SO_0444 family Cu/Zn efflux transporter [Deltaproteobacteria bacterium]|nr:SO_0444 family Cu/Zn efflux transporter [Deltaproteobacteria bacterium]